MTIRITVVMILLAAFLSSPSQVDARRIYDPTGNPPEGGWPVLPLVEGVSNDIVQNSGNKQRRRQFRINQIMIHEQRGA